MSQFIRIKRQDHTYFMHVEPTDSFLSVKAKVAELNDRQNAGDVRIFNTDRVRLSRSLAVYCGGGGAACGFPARGRAGPERPGYVADSRRTRCRSRIVFLWSGVTLVMPLLLVLTLLLP